MFGYCEADSMELALIFELSLDGLGLGSQNAKGADAVT